MLSTNTWQAYNQWGGKCLYSGATAVSFRRPIERGFVTRIVEADGYGGRVATIGDDVDNEQLQRYLASHSYPLWSASSGWFNWERRFVEWAEREGIELDYAVDADLDADDDVLDGRRLLVTAGHNEYWSWAMRDAVDRFVDAGGNWAILSGDTCFWQVRYSVNRDSMVCFKAAARSADPVRGTDAERTLTSCWSDPLIGRPETETIGLSFTRGGYHRVGDAVPRGSGSYTVQEPDHWVFAGTGLRYGDQVGAMATAVGYEVDGCALSLVDGRLRALPARTAHPTRSRCWRSHRRTCCRSPLSDARPRRRFGRVSIHRATWSGCHRSSSVTPPQRTHPASQTATP